MFSLNEVDKIEKSQNQGKIPSGKNNFNLYITLEQERGDRSAYPDFATQLSGLRYTVASSEFTETSGSYSSGVLSFNISSNTFSNKTITVYAKDSSNHILLSGSTKISFASGSTNITASVYLNQYEEATEKGFVSLTLLTSTSYGITCDVYNSDNQLVSGSGKPVTVSKSGQTTELSTADGITPGVYKAYIYVCKYNGSSLDTSTPYEFAIQTINIWPGMTTNKWYLPGGTINSEFTISVNSDEIKYYVKGSDPKGLYSSSGLKDVEAASDNSGTIMHPFDTVQSAINKCVNNSQHKYVIICDGNFTSGFSVGSKSSAKNINVEIIGGGKTDNLSTFGSTVIINSKKGVSLKNIKISGASQGLNLISASNAPAITLENCTISKNGSTTASGGGIFISSNTTVQIKNGVIINENEASKGAGIFLKDGAVLDMEAGSIYDNTAYASGGGIYGSASSTIYLHGSALVGSAAETIATSETDSSNKALGTETGDGGGGIYTAGNLYLGYKPGSSDPVEDTLEAGVKRNFAVEGGGIYVNDSETSVIKISSGSVSYNGVNLDSEGNGGGIRINAGSVIIDGTALVAHNYAYSSGGGISSNGSLQIDNGTISDNEAASGGGIYSSGSVTMSDGIIKDNKASCGGGIYSEGQLEISGGSIKKNVVEEMGGGIYCNSPSKDFKITGFVEVHNNEAAMYGGAIYIDGCNHAEINAGEFAFNSAAVGGAIETLSNLTINNINDEDLIFSRNSNTDADPSKDIYVSSGNLILGGKIAFDGEGSVLLSGGYQVQIIASLEQYQEGIPLYLGRDYGWTSGDQAIILADDSTATDLEYEVGAFHNPYGFNDFYIE